MTRAPLRSLALMLCAWLASCAAATLATAQTIRIDSSRTDSLRAIVKAGGTTFDSARVVWSYNGASSSRVLRANQTDTLRWSRATSPVAKRDALQIDYYTYPKVKSATFGIAALVVVPPVTPPPVVTTPTPTPNPAPTGSWVVPSLPATFSTAYPALTGVSIRVNNGGDLQAALNNAKPGDEIVLADGALFTGNYVIPAKVGTGGIVVRCESVLPPGRVVFGSNNCATIATPNTEPMLRTAPGAASWRFVGVKLTHTPPPPPATQYQNYGLIVLGSGTETSLAQMPSDIVFDRVQVSGSLAVGNSRCFAFNGIRLAVIDSDIRECHAKGQDAQGIGGWNGPGPFLVDNNHIEASGQGVMFGGADPRIRNVLPSDITVTRNHIFKPLSWGGGRWTVKAGFELKNGKRVLFEGNVIENHWADAQTGFAMLFQTLADNNTSWEWTTVQDLTVRYNVIRNSTSGANLLSRVAYNGGTMPTNPTSRVVIHDNVWENVGRDPISGNVPSIGVQLLGDLQDVTIANNTFTCACSMQKVLSFDGKPQARTTIVDNVFGASAYVLTGNATATGKWTLDVFAPGATFLRNNLPGARAQDYNAGALGSAVGADTLRIKAVTAGVMR